MLPPLKNSAFMGVAIIRKQAQFYLLKVSFWANAKNTAQPF
jgi:hypothetical protein